MPSSSSFKICGLAKLRSDRSGRATHNNPNAPEQSQVIGEVQRLSVSGDWERSAAARGLLGSGGASKIIKTAV